MFTKRQKPRGGLLPRAETDSSLKATNPDARPRFRCLATASLTARFPSMFSRFQTGTEGRQTYRPGPNHLTFGFRPVSGGWDFKKKAVGVSRGRSEGILAKLRFQLTEEF